MQSVQLPESVTAEVPAADLNPIIALINLRIATICVTTVTMAPAAQPGVRPALLAKLSVIPIYDNAAPFDVQFWKNALGKIVAVQTGSAQLLQYDLTFTAEILRLQNDLHYRLTTCSTEFGHVELTA